MEFLVFQRTDSALLVVPAMFQPPMACRRDGALQFYAVCDIDLDTFTPEVIAALHQDGFACIRGPDWEVLANIVGQADEETEPG